MPKTTSIIKSMKKTQPKLMNPPNEADYKSVIEKLCFENEELKKQHEDLKIKFEKAKTVSKYWESHWNKAKEVITDIQQYDINQFVKRSIKNDI